MDMVNYFGELIHWVMTGGLRLKLLGLNFLWNLKKFIFLLHFIDYYIILSIIASLK